LQRTIAANVTAFPAALAERSGRAVLRIPYGGKGHSNQGASLSAIKVQGSFTPVEVETKRIDDLGLSRIGFIKIDVEGMEHVVLGGMRYILEHHRPVILSELSDPLLKRNGSSSAAIIDFLRSFDYRVIDPLDERLAAGTRPYGDILCIPNGS